MNKDQLDNATAPRSVDQQQACALLHELQSRMNAMETAHHRLVWGVAKAAKWEPQGCDDQPAGIAESWCPNCRTCHYPLSGCPGDVGPEGPNADGTPGETEEEHMQRCRDAIANGKDE